MVYWKTRTTNNRFTMKLHELIQETKETLGQFLDRTYWPEVNWKIDRIVFVWPEKRYKGTSEIWKEIDAKIHAETLHDDGGGIIKENGVIK